MSLYEVKSLEVGEHEIDLRKWNLTSALDANITYKLRSPEPIEYFDCKERFLLKY